MKIINLFLKLFLVSLLIVSCADEQDLIKPLRGKYDNGIIVSAEGNFGNKDGSVSFISNSLDSLATNFVYKGVNNKAQLGGLIQSIAFTDTDAYIILNDVNTIVVVDRYTFKKKATIKTGLKNPRYMAIVNGKGYITNWGSGSDKTDDYLAVLNLKTNTLENPIPMDNGVEQIVSKGNKLYITHLGAWSTNNIVSVVDIATKKVVTKITVKDNPDEIFVDKSGNLIVLCQGRDIYDKNWKVIDTTEGAISFISTATNKITREIPFSKESRASLMSYANGKIYYYKGKEKKVYEINETAKEQAKDGIGVEKIYGMTVKENKLYTVKYAFTSLSKLTVIDLSSKKSIYSSEVGLGASKIYFN